MALRRNLAAGGNALARAGLGEEALGIVGTHRRDMAWKRVGGLSRTSRTTKIFARTSPGKFGDFSRGRLRTPPIMFPDSLQ